MVTVEVESVGGLRVVTERRNPAAVGAVTGSATFGAFLASVKEAGGRGPGCYLC